jgi:hypothetical protein
LRQLGVIQARNIEDQVALAARQTLAAGGFEQLRRTQLGHQAATGVQRHAQHQISVKNLRAKRAQFPIEARGHQPQVTAVIGVATFHRHPGQARCISPLCACRSGITVI